MRHAAKHIQLCTALADGAEQGLNLHMRSCRLGQALQYQRSRSSSSSPGRSSASPAHRMPCSRRRCARLPSTTTRLPASQHMTRPRLKASLLQLLFMKAW